MRLIEYITQEMPFTPTTIAAPAIATAKIAVPTSAKSTTAVSVVKSI